MSKLYFTFDQHGNGEYVKVPVEDVSRIDYTGDPCPMCKQCSQYDYAVLTLHDGSRIHGDWPLTIVPELSVTAKTKYATLV